MGCFENVNIKENVATVSTLNSHDLTIAGSATWDGTFEEATNQSAIQVIAKYDKDFTLTIAQGIDGANADITDTWECLANTGFATSVASVAPYYRVSITNKSALTATGSVTSAKTAILYDALTATNPICLITPPNGEGSFALEYGLDFYTGLTVVTTTANTDVTIVYE